MDPDGATAPRPSSEGSRRTTWAMLAVLGLFWGSTFPMVRLGVAAGASPLLLVAVDLFVAAGPMAIVAWARRATRPTPRAFLGSVVIGTVLVGGTNLLLFWGEQYATGGLAAIVFALTPLFAFVGLELSGRGARLSPLAVAALALGLGGIVALAYASLGTGVLSNPWGAVALFLGSACQAAGAVAVARWRPGGETPYGQAGQFLGGGITAVLVVAAVGGPLALPTSSGVLASMLYVAFATCVLGYALYFELIRRSGPIGANLVTYLNPVVALAVGVTLLGEAFGLPEALGLALVLLALFLFERETAHPAAGDRPGPGGWPRRSARSP